MMRTPSSPTVSSETGPKHPFVITARYSPRFSSGASIVFHAYTASAGARPMRGASIGIPAAVPVPSCAMHSVILPAGSSLMARESPHDGAARLIDLSASAYDLSMTVAGARETLSRPNLTSCSRVGGIGLHGACVFRFGVEMRLVEVQRQKAAAGGERLLAGVSHSIQGLASSTPAPRCRRAR